MPNSKKEKAIVISPKGTATKKLILPDGHWPHHDPACFAVVRHVIDVWQPDEIDILGDWADCAAFSKHGHRSLVDAKTSEYLSTEIAPINEELDYYQGIKSGKKTSTDRPIVFLEGNHENRVERFATELSGTLGAEVYKLLSPERLLRHRVDADGEPQGKRKNFKWVPYIGSWEHSHHKIAKDLIAVHGWSIARHAAAKHVDLARSVSVVHGHTHRAQSYTGRDPLTNKLIKAWSPGCLCKFVPIYMATQPNDWSHGFSMVYVGEKSWTDYTVNIQNGQCVLPDGRLING